MRLVFALAATSVLAVAAWPALVVAAGAAEKPVILLPGARFEGGARAHFGTTFYGRQEVNYVYARSNGPAARMAARVTLERVPRGRLFLFLEGMDDDAPGQCRVRVSLNGTALLQGPSGFSQGWWSVRALPIPDGVLRPGANEVAISCEEPEGPLGNPPWFMVARCAVAGRGYRLPDAQFASFTVRLPRRARPFPEPLPAGRTEPGFRFRGTKGWNWTPDQYLEVIPVLSRLKMNFLMNCYLSLFSDGPGGAWQNRWWEPMPPARKEAYSRIFHACRQHGITFCFAVHPQLGSPRPLVPGNDADLEQFYQHYAWAQEQGVQWFSVSLDDVSWGEGGPAAGGLAHAWLVNVIFGRLRQRDPAAQLIFCPVPYWGDGTAPEHRAYLEALAREMHPDVYVFWTGDAVVGPRITRRAAESYKRIVKHRLFLWDNYPVNDSAPTLHLGPLSGRDPDLCAVIDGYLSNPLCPQHQANCLPLATCADYAYNPWAYDPERSIGQAILRFAKTDAQRRVLKELVEAYPGFLVTGGGTGTNASRSRFDSLTPSSPAARRFVRHLEDLATRLAREFPRQFEASRQTLAADVAWMRQRLEQP
ncbi:MAG: hypothetical protein GX774_12575 [Armatimonadetes bacterium]|nr:hypothetical protein [Armatimonadota bacterium]